MCVNNLIYHLFTVPQLWCVFISNSFTAGRLLLIVPILLYYIRLVGPYSEIDNIPSLRGYLKGIFHYYSHVCSLSLAQLCRTCCSCCAPSLQLFSSYMISFIAPFLLHLCVRSVPPLMAPRTAKKTLDEGAQQGLLGRVVPQESSDGQRSENLRKFDWSFENRLR